MWPQETSDMFNTPVMPESAVNTESWSRGDQQV